MQAPKAHIVNKLNAVAAHSDDSELRKFAENLIDEIRSSSTNTEAMPPKQMKNGVPTADKAIEYFKSKAYLKTDAHREGIDVVGFLVLWMDIGSTELFAYPLP